VAERIGGAWARFCDASDAWLRIERSVGREALERVYADVVAGRSDPAVGHILSL
jgi:hypothetical protein